MDDHESFSDYDTRTSRHQPRKPCHFCKQEKIESEITRIPITGDHICYDCEKAMTLKEAIEYVKAGEEIVDPQILMQFIHHLYPQHQPVKAPVNNIVNKSVKTKKQ